MTTPPDLATVRQRRLLDFLAAYEARHGSAPTRREIARAIGVTSSGGVQALLERMESRGLICRTPGRVRGLRVVPAAVASLRDLVAVADELLANYRAERDLAYDALTTMAGEYTDPDDKAAIDEMDAIITRAETVIAAWRTKPEDTAS